MRNRGYASTEVSEPEHEVKVVSSPTYAAVKSVDDYAYSSRGSHSSSSSGTTRLENERIAEDQNKNAKYNFALAFDDGYNFVILFHIILLLGFPQFGLFYLVRIMDSSQVRQESRDGLKVTIPDLILPKVCDYIGTSFYNLGCFGFLGRWLLFLLWWIRKADRQVWGWWERLPGFVVSSIF